MKTRIKISSLTLLVITIPSIFLVRKQKASIKYTGTVIDSTTKLPIPNAKVILITWPYGIWNSSPTQIGILTDHDGFFSIESSPGYWIDNIDISAISPADKFAHLRNPNPKTHLNLILSEPDPVTKKGRGVDYETFSGGWYGDVHWIPQNK